MNSPGSILRSLPWPRVRVKFSNYVRIRFFYFMTKTGNKTKFPTQSKNFITFIDDFSIMKIYSFIDHTELNLRGQKGFKRFFRAFNLWTHLDPYCDPCHDRVYGSNSSIMDGSFSMESVLAHEQVIAEQRNTLIINMTRKRMPNAMQR